MTRSSELPRSFRHVRLVLARERNHPLGETEEGYDLLVPLTEDGHLDAAAWKTHQADCRVRAFRAGEEDRVGKLRRKPGGQWYFDYKEGDRDDEAGFRLGDEIFVTGEYISIVHRDGAHTYQVARVALP